MRERILLCKPKMCGREIDFIKPALAEDWAVPMEPDVTVFENELGAAIGAKNVVALESGTSAIHLALILCGVKPGAEGHCSINDLLRFDQPNRISWRDSGYLWILRESRGI